MSGETTLFKSALIGWKDAEWKRRVAAMLVVTGGFALIHWWVRSKSKSRCGEHEHVRVCSVDPNDSCDSLQFGRLMRGLEASGSELFPERDQMTYSQTTLAEFVGRSGARRTVVSCFEHGTFHKFMKFVHRNVLGTGELMETPFGATQIIYCDWTASGRQFIPIEKYLYSHVSTMYANTHTDTSITGVQSTRYYNEARDIVLDCCGGDAECDVAIFCGSGASGCMDKLMRVISRWHVNVKAETVVFITAMEHNTNLLIWTDNGFTTVTVPPTADGALTDDVALERLLKEWRAKKTPFGNKYHIFCSFVAASNVTGILADTDKVSALVHKYDGYIFWDFATAGPYVHIGMNGPRCPRAAADSPLTGDVTKDAVFIATHKCLGGPSSPGILVAKKHLFRNEIPAIPAGGTVAMAFGNDDRVYHSEISAKEEGGTQDIIGAVRAALTLSLKEQIGTEVIKEVEFDFSERFIKEVVDRNPNLFVLAGVRSKTITKETKLPIFSVNVLHKKWSEPSEVRYLHCNFVAALLNDVFGIQGRPGCMCAGSYIKYLLGFKDMAHFRAQFEAGRGPLSYPGMYRLNFHYSMAPDEFHFVCEAVNWVCEHGWKLLPLYSVDGASGMWRHNEWRAKADSGLRSLRDIVWDRDEGRMRCTRKHRTQHRMLKYFNVVMATAQEIIDNLSEYLPVSIDEVKAAEVNCEDEHRWYFLPSELYQDAVHYCVESDLPPVTFRREEWKEGHAQVYKTWDLCADSNRCEMQKKMTIPTKTDAP